MKIILFIVALFLGFNANSQSHVIIGDWEWIDAMFYFEVTDGHNGTSMSGIKVELLDGRVNVATAYTNHRGAALFIIKGVRHLASNMTFRIQKESYSTWNKTLESQYDVLRYMKDHQIGIVYRDNRGMKQDRRPKSRPEDIQEILRGNFRKLHGSSSGYGGTNFPGIMQFKVSLNYSRHPKDQRRYNNSGNNRSVNQSTVPPSKDYGEWIRSEKGNQISFDNGMNGVGIFKWNPYRNEVLITSDSWNSEKSMGEFRDIEEAWTVLKKHMDNHPKNQREREYSSSSYSQASKDNPLSIMGIVNVGDTYKGWKYTNFEYMAFIKGESVLVLAAIGKIYQIHCRIDNRTDPVILNGGMCYSKEGALSVVKKYIDNH